ncbi:hypothetical protein [Aneurinibacillus sp. REN35]|uniref:hypothetical protein n=1 Tax=Aneurinibacillus sp. REN35 TaxID=3237286 RepID=UPI003528BC55
MFFHGIPLPFLRLQHPVLSSRTGTDSKTTEQISDREHLIQQFGIEPVHLLEYRRGEYTLQECLRACFEFGDVVLAFRYLPLPMWQISRHEVGVAALALHRTRWLFVMRADYIAELKQLFPDVPIFALHEQNGKFCAASKRVND